MYGSCCFVGLFRFWFRCLLWVVGWWGFLRWLRLLTGLLASLRGVFH